MMAGGFSATATKTETASSIKASRSQPLQPSDVAERIEIRWGEARPRRASL